MATSKTSVKLKPLRESIRLIKNFEAVSREAAKWRYRKPEKRKRILNDFYTEEMKRRLAFEARCEKDREYCGVVLAFLSEREQIIDWICDWCWTTDPRNLQLGLPARIPWIPFERQVKMIEWVYNLYMEQEGGLIEKSREVGATWTFQPIMVHEWRWQRGFIGGMGSSKEINVDQRNNPKCMFEKTRDLIYNQPKWWMPAGFVRRVHDTNMKLYNPELESVISGEAGDNIGRGGRYSLYLVDEKAFVENQQAVDSSLSQATPSQFDLSTPNGPNDFFKKRSSGRVPVFTFNWRHDPRKDDNWYDHEKARLDPVIVAQEIDINYQASVEGLFIKPEWVEAAVGINLPARGRVGTGLDVAAGGRNRSACVTRHGPVVLESDIHVWNFDNGIDMSHEAIEKSNKAGSAYLNYDRIGVGFAAHSAFARTEAHMVAKPYGLLSGERASDTFYEEFNRRGFEIFLNARAEWWYMVAKRFERTYEVVQGKAKYPADQLISIPNHGDLKTQLSSVRKFRTDRGKIKAEGKDIMISRGIESPDIAEGLIYSFIPQNAGVSVIWPDWDRVIIVPRGKRPERKGEEVPMYRRGVTIQHSHGYVTAKIVWFYNQYDRLLWVHKEHKGENIGSGENAAHIWKMLNGRKPNLAIANPEIFGKDVEEDAVRHTQAMEYGEEKLDFEAATGKAFLPSKIARTQTWIRNGWVTASEDCREFMRQCRNWARNPEGEPTARESAYCLCLVNTIEGLEAKAKPEDREVDQAYFEWLESGMKGPRPHRQQRRVSYLGNKVKV